MYFLIYNLLSSGHPVIHCIGHRANNVLKSAFYQTAQRKQRKIIKASTTPAKKQLKKYQFLCVSSSDNDSSDDDDIATSSPSKYAEAIPFNL